MKIIVAGSRTFTDKNYVWEVIDKSKFDIIELVSGGARGVDSIAQEWARDKNIKISEFIPHYNIENPRYAPLLRNVDMANYADGLIAIWVNKSKGTEHMINTMNKLGKPIEVYEI